MVYYYSIWIFLAFHEQERTPEQLGVDDIMSHLSNKAHLVSYILMWVVNK